jgi:chemotaxis family two-component system response regulator PixG
MNTTVQQKSVVTFPVRNNAVLLDRFTVSKQIELFDTLKQIQFSGQLVLRENRGSQWNFHMCQGHVLYVTGGTHPVKRWLRNIKVLFPQIDPNPIALKQELDEIAGEKYSICWQYQLLSAWVRQQKITREQATKIIWLIFVEVLFNLAGAKEVTYELRAENFLVEQLTNVDIRQASAEADRQLQLWQTAHINFSPDLVPIIKQAEQLQQNTSISVYQALKQLLDGKQTLRDLAVQMKRDVAIVASSLLPFIQLGLVELTNAPDAIAPITSIATNSFKPQKPSIATVDDSPLICHVMETILSKAGYRFMSVNDPLKSINVVLALKPNLIFLDLVMPNLDGYQVCGKLRKYSHLRNTPIIILTANDGPIDRVRAKLVGASGFMSKSKVDAQLVLKVTQKHLKNYTLSNIS